MRIATQIVAVVALASAGVHAYAAPLMSSSFAPSCSKDADTDRLTDCVEYASRVSISAQYPGTNPNLADTDGDGLGDGDEVLGTLGGLNLRAMGANPLHKDILVEFDWFDDYLSTPTKQHSHRPSAQAIESVRRLFASAPVQNPSGATGINFIADYGTGGPFSGGNRISGYSAALPGQIDDTYHAIKAANFSSKRLGYFHYSLVAHSYNGGSTSSGVARYGDDDSIISLGIYYRNDFYVASTIAHEIGHNLDLRHGGFEDCNGKPNYNSIMNYRFQFEGVDEEPNVPNGCDSVGNYGKISFSNGRRRILNESSLDERVGVCNYPLTPIDWNRNGIIESSVAYDLNPQYPECYRTILHDFNDWAEMKLPFSTSKSTETSPQCPAPPAN